MARCTNPFVKEPSKNCPKVTEFGSLEVCDACDDYQSEPPAQMICDGRNTCEDKNCDRSFAHDCKKLHPNSTGSFVCQSAMQLVSCNHVEPQPMPLIKHDRTNSAMYDNGFEEGTSLQRDTDMLVLKAALAAERERIRRAVENMSYGKMESAWGQYKKCKAAILKELEER